MEQKKKECDELKELYIQLRASKDSINKQLENEKEINNNLNFQLQKLTSQINDLNNKIKSKDELINKYKLDKEKIEAEFKKLKENDVHDKNIFNEVCKILILEVSCILFYCFIF